MTTALWEYRPASHPAADMTLVGYEVEGTDGPLGRVERDAGDHLLVDSGVWVPGTRVPVPVGLVARIDHLELVVHLDCPRARVRSVPPPAVVVEAGGGGPGPRGRSAPGARHAD